MRNMHGWRVAFEIVPPRGNRQFPPISNRPEGHRTARPFYLGVTAMTRFSLLKIFRNAFAAPACYVSRYDRVDAKLLPLVSQRYV